MEEINIFGDNDIQRDYAVMAYIRKLEDLIYEVEEEATDNERQEMLMKYTNIDMWSYNSWLDLENYILEIKKRI